MNPNKINMMADIVGQMTERTMQMGHFRIKIIKTEILDRSIIWTQLLLYDKEALPIRLDILKDIYNTPTKTIYASPGTGLNTESNFITPKTKNIATFLVNKGYFFVGITPREDASPPIFNFGLFKNWGLNKHTRDFNKIVSLFQDFIDQDYDILGHSAGALVVLNYASKYPADKLKSVRLIDIVGRYLPDSQEFLNAKISKSAADELIRRGVFTDTDILGFKILTQNARDDPTGDSGFQRPIGDNFTNEGLLFFALINTGQLPGVLTDATGLPSSWYFKQGFCAGEYSFGATPAEDTYMLAHTDIQTIFDAVASIGSGIYPLAYDRDFYALWSDDFNLDFGEISAPVFYINTELGFGDASFTRNLIGNVAAYDVVAGYGHADPVFSDTADTDFWGKLFPE